MLTKEMQLAIMEGKSVGLTLSEVRKMLEEKNFTPPSDSTLRRYYRRDTSDEPIKAQPKEKAFDTEPFRSCIIETLRNNPDACVSAIYDLLVERFIETGEYERLPASQRSLQNYVNYLRVNDIVSKAKKEGRIYDHVFDTEPGDQLLIDFGDYNLGDRIHFYFICLLLRYSRYLVVYGQDHKYNSEEACRDIYRCFLKLGGRPKRLVIDQDAVFINTETYGEVIKTQTFEGFCREQKLNLFVCRKADPESKGPIENSVKYVKTGYLSARSDHTVKQLVDGLPGWLARKNSRIHRATYCVPKQIYESYEKNSLRELLPSVYYNSPRSFIEVELKNYPYVLYRTNKYYYPSANAFEHASYRVVDGTIYLYDKDRKLVTQYAVSPLRGKSFQHEGFRKEPTKYLKTIEHMRSRWNCADFQHFVNGVKKESKGRYLNERFEYISTFLDKMDPDPRLVSALMHYCCEHFRYTPDQVEASYRLLMSENAAFIEVNESPMSGVSRSLEEYDRVFDAVVDNSKMKDEKENSNEQ